MRLRADRLEIEHPEYQALSPYWRTVRDLKDGAIAIKRNIERYLPMRPDEDRELYALRLGKFSYTPVMTDAIGKYSAKLASSPVHLSNAEDYFWETFRANNNSPKGAMRKESGLLQEIFASLLYYSKVWVAIDMLETDVVPRTAYESKAVNNPPYCQLYDPLSVINWGDGWAVVRTIYPLVVPFEFPKTIARWTYYTQYSNIIYEAEVKLKAFRDSEGNICDKVDRVLIGDKWLPLDDENAILEPIKEWQHGLGMLLLDLSIPMEKWVGKQVYLKQIQHLRIENAWTDAGYLSGVVQRLFTPPDVPPMDDARIVYEQPDYAKELARAGNTHILIGNGYQFVESTGAALGNLEGQLNKIEQQIKELVSLHFASGSKGMLEQSGISKEIDMTLLEDSMATYGQIVLALYNMILRLVSKIKGLPTPLAVGLSNYTVDSTDGLINQLTLVEQLPYVPPTAKKIAYAKLAQLMVGTASPEDEKAIKEELEVLFSKPKAETEGTDKEEILQAVIDEYGLSEEEYQYLYGSGGSFNRDLNSMGLSEEAIKRIVGAEYA